ncbi:hypothetical protein PHJA_000281400 [Phtheirospermum japonicum]|uniref:Uncharacterized protein n=1 Tax=Phtheirospermum japonicum TaxID=374723 RepID=A0A830BH75_9LAMI|nr:hypothetical protein PHJA_000281400 [Phtheirospermum japonicum]
MTEPNTALKIHDSIPEHESEEVFGIILSRKPSVSAAAMAEQEVGKRSFSIRRSASVCEGYSRIDHQCGLSAGADDDKYGSGFITTQKRCVKKKGKFLGAFRRLFGL